LERAWEQDGQAWAKQMKGLLETINRKVIDAGGALDDKGSHKYHQKYRDLLKQAEIECPEPIPVWTFFDCSSHRTHISIVYLSI
jgi:transposase